MRASCGKGLVNAQEPSEFYTGSFKPEYAQNRNYPLHDAARNKALVLSGGSSFYKSDEVFTSLQIDEQISTHEQYLEKLKKIKKEQEERERLKAYSPENVETVKDGRRQSEAH